MAQRYVTVTGVSFGPRGRLPQGIEVTVADVTRVPLARLSADDAEALLKRGALEAIQDDPADEDEPAALKEPPADGDPSPKKPRRSRSRKGQQHPDET